MILRTILCLTTSLFLSLPKINNPITITLIIVLIALITASIFCITLSSWYAFLIFLIYVGGILVIFAYFTATSPNQQHMRNKRIIKTVLFILLITIPLTALNNQTLVTTKSHQLIRLYTSHNIYTLILITIILLITIVIVVKLSSRSKGPLRTFIT